VNSVIAFGYYGRVMRAMWMREPADGDVAPIRVPQPLTLALGLTVVTTIVIGVIPQVVLRYGDLGSFTDALGK
jgi:NADH-quinone oxidoreductase subunit N